MRKYCIFIIIGGLSPIWASKSGCNRFFEENRESFVEPLSASSRIGAAPKGPSTSGESPVLYRTLGKDEALPSKAAELPPSYQNFIDEVRADSKPSEQPPSHLAFKETGKDSSPLPPSIKALRSFPPSKEELDIQERIRGEYYKLAQNRDHVLTDTEMIRWLLDRSDVRGKFSHMAFALLPAIQAKEGPTGSDPFRIKETVRFVLKSQEPTIIIGALKVIFDQFERWMPFISRYDLYQLEGSSVWQSPLLKKQPLMAELKRTVSNLQFVMKSNEESILYYQNRNYEKAEALEHQWVKTFSANIVNTPNNIAIKRLSVIVALRIYSTLHKYNPEVYQKPHPTFQNSVLLWLDFMADHWDGGAPFSRQALELILQNENLFGVRKSEMDPQKAHSKEDIQEMVRKIRKKIIADYNIPVI